MATRMSTRRRMDRIRDKMAASRTVNGELKRKESARRDARMSDLVKNGNHPYTPAVQSWLSTKLDKPFRQVTESEAKELASGGKPTTLLGKVAAAVGLR